MDIKSVTWFLALVVGACLMALMPLGSGCFFSFEGWDDDADGGT